MRQSAKEQKLEALESEFKPLLIACLRECANGRWGLFGQNDRVDDGNFLAWPEADRLQAMAAEINALRSQFGESNPLANKLAEFSSMRGENIKGEPRLARQFLAEIGDT